LGLNLLEHKEKEIPESVLSLAKERDMARKAKDFKRSDEIRDKIASLGYNIQDSPEGTKVTLK
jgi:cysteinyl-tRNA synthetase